jgi:predicted Rossmann fold flavoprotein
MPSPGIKLLISGSNQCNITHDGSVDGFYRRYGRADNFVKYTLKNFSNKDLISFFESRGIQFTVTDHGKIFPRSSRSKDILDAIIDECRNRLVTLAVGEPVKTVEPMPSGGFHCTTAYNNYRCKYLVIATGGKSYPKTGSSGDGYRLAQSLGHSIVTPKPALAPVIAEDYDLAGLAGVSLQDKTVSLWRGNKKIASEQGSILLTHTGLSGPCILNISRYAQHGDILRIDLAGSACLSFTQFKDILSKSNNLQISTVLRNMNIPRQLACAIVTKAGVQPSQQVNSIKKDMRRQVYELVGGLPFTVKSTGGFDEAIVTAGGVERTEITARTMQSKLNPNLFFAGEIIDVDGDEGGYNLQFAFSSGMLAGSSISNLLSNEKNCRAE